MRSRGARISRNVYAVDSRVVCARFEIAGQGVVLVETADLLAVLVDASIVTVGIARETGEAQCQGHGL